MGDKGQVYIQDDGVYLYTHWDASELIEIVKRALAKRWRWDDSEYLARIIFDEMVDEHGTETGYGIGTVKHGDVWRVMEINCKNEKVRVIDNGVVVLEKSFEDFIKEEG